MSERITYDNKVPLNNREEINDINKHTANDDNEIKSVVNSHADDIEVLQSSQVSTGIAVKNYADRGDGNSFLPAIGAAGVLYTVLDDTVEPDKNGNWTYDNSTWIQGEVITSETSKLAKEQSETNKDQLSKSDEVLKTDKYNYIGRNIVVNYPDYLIDTFSGNSKKSYVTEGYAIGDTNIDSIGIYFTHEKETRVKVFLNTYIYLDTTINTTIGENKIDLDGYLNLKDGDIVQVAYESVDGSDYNLTYVNNPTPSDDWFKTNRIALGSDVINAERALTGLSTASYIIPVNFYLKNRDFKNVNQSGIDAASSLVSGDYDSLVLSPSNGYVYDETSGNTSNTKLTYAIMQSDKKFNKVGVFVRGVSTDTIDGDLLVKIFINGIVKGSHTIPQEEIEKISIIGDDSLLIADLGSYMEAKSGDEVCVGYTSLGTYKIALTYKANNTPSDSNEFTRNYNISSNSIDLASLENAPDRPASQNYFYIPFNLYNTELSTKSITTNEVIYPHRLYHAVSDADPTGFTGNYSISLYVDHFINKRSVLFNNQKDRILLPANVIKTGDGTAQFNSGVNVDSQTKDIYLNDGRRLRYNMKSVMASAQNKDAFVLSIGDSITYGIGTMNDMTGSTDKGLPYWVTTGQLLEDNKTSNNNVMLGSNRGKDLTGGQRACAEGRSAWSLFNYMRHSTNLKEESGYIALGYTDPWTRSEAQLAAIATTNEIDPGGLPPNPFYDGSLSGSNRFSVSKWLERYRTMDDSGNRLSLGDPSLGTEINTQSQIDSTNVMTPTHIVLALGTNDSYFGTIDTYYSNMMEMITTIRAQLPNCSIGVMPVPDTAGTYYPEIYDIDGSEHHSDHLKRFEVYKNLSNKILTTYSEEADKTYVLPTYFTAPTARAYNLRDVNSVGEDIKQDAFGDAIHVSHYAHDSWAYILYSWIKYTTSI